MQSYGYKRPNDSILRVLYEQYSQTVHVPWALYCLVTVKPLSRDEMKT